LEENSRGKPVVLRELLKNWRVKVSAIVIAFNVEIVVIPWILIWFLDLSGSVLRNVAGIWSTIEMCWWVYFSSWAPSQASRIKSVAEAIELGKEVGPEFVSEAKDTDSAKKIEEFISEHTVDKFSIDHWQNSRPYIYSMAILKAFGYTLGWFFILILSAIPFPVLWIPGLVLCRKNGWRFGYSALFMGNFIKNYFYAYIWELVWPYRLYMFAGLLTVIASVFVHKVYKKLTWKDLLLKIIVYFSRPSKNHQ